MQRRIIPTGVWQAIHSARFGNLEGAMSFVGFVLSDEARRVSVRGRRQKLPMKGRDISYGLRVERRRGSDRSERIYVAIMALQNSGLTNYQACCEVANCWESKLGTSCRGRPKTTTREREFADKVETIRSSYNRFKERHPWREQLPQHDPVYGRWYWMFRQFQHWAVDKILASLESEWSGEQMAHELLEKRGEGGRLNYHAISSLGEEGLLAAVKVRILPKAKSKISIVQARKFIREFTRQRPR